MLLRLITGRVCLAVEFSGIDASLFLGGFESSFPTNLRFVPPVFIVNVKAVEGSDDPGSRESCGRGKRDILSDRYDHDREFR